MYFFRLRTLVLVLVYAVGFVELSAQVKDSILTNEIEEIIVTEKYHETEIRSSAPLQILSTKQIEKLNALQVSDAVKYFSGVTVKDYGGIGGLKTVSVRSLGATHTTVSYDGISLTDNQTGQIDIGRFSLDNVDMLSLNNGQSDNIFQPARLFSLASLLNIKTNSPQFAKNEKIKGKASLKVGSFAMYNPSLLIDGKINSQLSATFSGEWLKADGRYPYTLNYQQQNGLSSKEKRENTDVDNLRLEGGLFGNFGEKGKGYVKAYYFRSDRGLPGATIFYNTQNFSTQRMNDETFFVQSHYETNLSKVLAWQVNAKYNYGYMHYTDPASLNEQKLEENEYWQREYYLSTTLLYKAFRNLSFSFATDGFITTLDADYHLKGADIFAYPKRYSWLSNIAAKYVTDNILINGSLLATVVNETVKQGNSGNDYTKLSPYLSLAVKPFNNHDLRFRIFYKNIFRLPSFNDLYYLRIGNTGLKPENTNQFNIGATYAVSIGKWMPLFSATLDVYHNDVTDKIVAMPTKNIAKWTMLNYGKVDVDGLDFTVEATLFPFDDKFGFVLGGTYTHQKAIDNTDAVDGSPTSGRGKGSQIPYTPRNSGSGRFGVETPWIDLSYSLLWSASRFSLFENIAENRLPGYTDHSVSASRLFRLNKKLALSATIEILNLGNKNYEIVRWFPMPGRSWRTTIALKF